MVARQGGNPRVVDDDRVLPSAGCVAAVPAPCSGIVQSVDAERVGRASMLLGAGRARADATIDPAAGIIMEVEPGHAVAAGSPLMYLHHNGPGALAEATALAASAVTIGDEPVAPAPLILDWIHT
jgi:thymidine phosphorylase